MTIKAFFKTTGTVSLKALRALWCAFSAMMTAFVWALVECLKHASAADDKTSAMDTTADLSQDYERRRAWGIEP